MPPILTVLFVLIILGLIWWLVDTQLPLPAPFKMIAKVILIVILLVYLFSLIGWIPPLQWRTN